MPNSMKKLTAISACLLAFLGGFLAPNHANAQQTYSTVAFAGVDVSKDSYATWAGFLHWLNRDWEKDGFLVRGLGVYGEYDYTGGPLGVTPIDGEFTLFDAMIGYQIVRDGHRFAAYVGVERQDHDLSPNDPTNDINGDETGFKVLAEARLRLAPKWEANLKGSYSTAYDTYWSYWNIGYQVAKNIKIGPEGYFTGNEDNDAQRIGGFVELATKIHEHPVYFTFAGGHQFGEDGGGSTFNSAEGAYGNFGIAIAF